MNKIEKLIQEFCPDGVEYYELGDIGKITIGEFVHKSRQSENGRYPVYNGGTTNTGLYDDFNNTSNKIVVSARGANAGYVNKVLVDYWAGNSCYSISFIDNFKIDWIFVYYYLKQNEHKLIGDQQKGGIPAISKKMIERFKIPVPPLPVQQEIVNILDKFTQLDEELNAELEIRRIQYDCYLNQLMGFEDSEVEWKTLGEVGEFIRGNGLQKKDFTETGVGCIHYGQIYTHYGISAVETKSFVSPELAFKLKKAKKGDLIIAATSENVEDVCKAVAWLGDDEIAISGDAFIFTHNQNSKYISYFFQSIFFNDQKVKFTTGTKVIRVSINNLEKIVIPIPPLSEQERIVSILDKFDSLVNDTTIGIPAEIEARRKQYAYYRNKLLTFGEYA